jgi:hypothetical protein
MQGIRWLHREYETRGWSRRWGEEINRTIAKQSAAYGRPTPPEHFHTCALLEAVTCSKPESMRATLQLLLEVGCRLDVLARTAATNDLPLVGWWVMLKHVSKVAAHFRGMDGSGWQHLLATLLAMCARKAPSAEQYAAALRALQQHGGGVTLKRPLRYPGDTATNGHGGVRAEGVSLLLRTVQCDTTHALLGVCQVLDERPDGQDILAMHAPGLLIAAVRDGRLGHCRALLDRGASVLLPDEHGVHALWAAAAARKEAVEKVALLCEALRTRFAARREVREDLRRRLAAEGPGSMSLAQWALANWTLGVIEHLEAMGVQLNVAYEGGDPPLRAACTVPWAHSCV